MRIIKTSDNISQDKSMLRNKSNAWGDFDQKALNSITSMNPNEFSAVLELLRMATQNASAMNRVKMLIENMSPAGGLEAGKESGIKTALLDDRLTNDLVETEAPEAIIDEPEQMGDLGSSDVSSIMSYIESKLSGSGDEMLLSKFEELKKEIPLNHMPNVLEFIGLVAGKLPIARQVAPQIDRKLR
jgi:hypothetical protein